METVVEIGEYKGSPIIKIYEVREDGAKRDVPLISFGVRKAKAVDKHSVAIKKFIAENQNNEKE